MEFIGLFCPAVISVLFLKKRKEKGEFFRQLKLYGVSLVIVNLCVCLMQKLFGNGDHSPVYGLANSNAYCLKYLGLAVIFAVIWGIALRYLESNLSFELKNKDTKDAEKEDKPHEKA